MNNTHDTIWEAVQASKQRIAAIERDMERRSGVDRRVPSTLSPSSRRILARLLREERREERRTNKGRRSTDG